MSFFIVVVKRKTDNKTYLCRYTKSPRMNFYPSWYDMRFRKTSINNSTDSINKYTLQNCDAVVNVKNTYYIFFENDRAFNAFYKAHIKHDSPALSLELESTAGLTARIEAMKRETSANERAQTISRLISSPIRDINTPVLMTLSDVDDRKHTMYNDKTFYINYIISCGNRNIKVGRSTGKALSSRLAAYRSHLPVITAFLVVLVPSRARHRKNTQHDNKIKEHFSTELAVSTDPARPKEWIVGKNVIPRVLDKYMELIGMDVKTPFLNQMQ